MKKAFAVLFAIFLVTAHLVAGDFFSDYIDSNNDLPVGYKEPVWMRWIMFMFISIVFGIGMPGIVWDEAVKSFDLGKIAGAVLATLVGVPLGIAGIFFMHHCILG